MSRRWTRRLRTRPRRWPRTSRRRLRKATAISRGSPRSPEQLPPGRPLKDRVGHAGEAAALAYLKEQGFRILARDWRSRIGQIDIVAEDGETLVLIEVKARRGIGFGTPAEAVDERKQRKLRMLLEVYRSQTHRLKQPCRIDVIGLLMDGSLKVTSVEHIKDAVQEA